MKQETYIQQLELQLKTYREQSNLAMREADKYRLEAKTDNTQIAIMKRELQEKRKHLSHLEKEHKRRDVAIQYKEKIHAKEIQELRSQLDELFAQMHYRLAECGEPSRPIYAITGNELNGPPKFSTSSTSSAGERALYTASVQMHDIKQQLESQASHLNRIAGNDTRTNFEATLAALSTRLAISDTANSFSGTPSCLRVAELEQTAQRLRARHDELEKLLEESGQTKKTAAILSSLEE